MLAQGYNKWPSQTSYFHRGTSPYEIWYTAAQNQTAFSTLANTVGRIRGLPIPLSRPVTIDRIAFEVTTGGGAGSVGRCGIYRATSLTNIYPSSLVVDSGEFDCTTIGVKAATVSVMLSAGLYWLVTLFGVAAPTVRRLVAAGIHHMVGVNSTLATNFSDIDVAQTYGALPSTCPAGGSLSTGNPQAALVALRFSA